ELLEKVQGPAPVPEDEKDKEKKPGDKPDRKLPLPIPRMPAKAEVPEELKKLFESRPGYANYYFNQLERDRVWQAFASKSDFAGQGGAWQLRGELDDGGKVEFTLRDDGVACRWIDEAFTFDAAQDFDAQLAPNQSGGLLAALHVWRRMLVR